MCPGVSFEEYVHCIGNDPVNLGFLAEESDVCGGVVATSVWTSRPVYRKRFGIAEFRLQMSDRFHGAFFGFNQREVAVVDASATHHATHDFRWVISEFL